MLTKLLTKNVTNVDAVMMCPQKGFVGLSFGVDISWTGLWNLADPFLLDFSLAKKFAKKILSEFDHSIWVHPQSLCVNQKMSDPQNALAVQEGVFGTCAVFTKKSSFSLLSDFHAVEKTLSDLLKSQCPFPQIQDIQVIFTQRQKALNGFAYSHAICVHDGKCQQFHGHTGVAEVWKEGRLNKQLSAQLAKSLQNKVFLTKKAWVQQPEQSERFGEMLKLCPQLEALDWASHFFCDYKHASGETALIVPRSRMEFLPSESSAECLTLRLKHDLINRGESHDKIVLYEGLYNAVEL